MSAMLSKFWEFTSFSSLTPGGNCDELTKRGLVSSLFYARRIGRGKPSIRNLVTDALDIAERKFGSAHRPRTRDGGRRVVGVAGDILNYPEVLVAVVDKIASRHLLVAVAGREGNYNQWTVVIGNKRISAGQTATWYGQLVWDKKGTPRFML